MHGARCIVLLSVNTYMGYYFGLWLILLDRFEIPADVEGTVHSAQCTVHRQSNGVH